MENHRPVLMIGETAVTPAPGAFLQALRSVEREMAKRVVDHLAPCARVADLFCGHGAFALRLAESSSVLAAEQEGAALEALHEAWRGASGKLRPVEVQQRDLFRRPVMATELKKCTGVVFDPPRAGAQA